MAIYTMRHNIVGPLPKALGSKRYFLVFTDYFTKWVVAIPLVHITTNGVLKFLWQDIFYKFGILLTIVTNNSKQFSVQKIATFYKSLALSKTSPPYTTLGAMDKPGPLTKLYLTH